MSQQIIIDYWIESDLLIDEDCFARILGARNGFAGLLRFGRNNKTTTVLRTSD